MKFHITIYMGIEFTQAGEKLSAHQVEGALRVIEHAAAELTGGFTLSETTGGWLNEGRIVRERGWRLDVVVDDVRVEPLEVARTLGKVCSGELDQACVLVETFAVDSYFV